MKVVWLMVILLWTKSFTYRESEGVLSSEEQADILVRTEENGRERGISIYFST